MTMEHKHEQEQAQGQTQIHTQAHSFSYTERKMLIAQGFTWDEIKALETAINPAGALQPLPDLSSPAWVAAIHRRHEFADMVRHEFIMDYNRRMPRQVYNHIINHWYLKNKKRTPFDWLKVEYKPKLKVDFKNAAIERAKHKAAGKIGNLHRAFKRYQLPVRRRIGTTRTGEAIFKEE